MQTKISEEFRHSAQGQEAEQILRQCVHCGMCNATCPTYQLLGDELDGPRGRIYLIKQVLEGQQPTQKTQTHLDRCLTCRSCETTCPSGVQYARLLEIGRDIVEQKVKRPIGQRVLRGALKKGLSNPRLFQLSLRWGQIFKSVLPSDLQEKIPAVSEFGVISPVQQVQPVQHTHKVILLEGCVQPSLAPNINAATRRVLDCLGIQVVTAPKAGCCGAVPLHLSDRDAAILAAKNNIDAWWPLVVDNPEHHSPESRSTSIVSNASGCGVMLKDYAHLLAYDSAYAEKAKTISALSCDLSELLAMHLTEMIALFGGEINEKLVWHPPCSLQHGQQVRGKVETILQSLGIALQTCADSHLCCGSAGTYSILQSNLSKRLRDNKVKALEASGADIIVSANMACQHHIQTATTIPVRHWIELLDEVLAKRPIAVTIPVAKEKVVTDDQVRAKESVANVAVTDSHIEPAVMESTPPVQVESSAQPTQKKKSTKGARSKKSSHTSATKKNKK